MVALCGHRPRWRNEERSRTTGTEGHWQVPNGGGLLIGAMLGFIAWIGVGIFVWCIL